MAVSTLLNTFRDFHCATVSKWHTPQHENLFLEDTCVMWAANKWLSLSVWVSYNFYAIWGVFQSNSSLLIATLKMRFFLCTVYVHIVGICCQSLVVYMRNFFIVLLVNGTEFQSPNWSYVLLCAIVHLSFIRDVLLLSISLCEDSAMSVLWFWVMAFDLTFPCPWYPYPIHM